MSGGYGHRGWWTTGFEPKLVALTRDAGGPGLLIRQAYLVAGGCRWGLGTKPPPGERNCAYWPLLLLLMRHHYSSLALVAPLYVPPSRLAPPLRRRGWSGLIVRIRGWREAVAVVEEGGRWRPSIEMRRGGRGTMVCDGEAEGGWRTD